MLALDSESGSKNNEDLPTVASLSEILPGSLASLALRPIHTSIPRVTMMISFKQYRGVNPGFSEIINYAAVVSKQVMLNKDSSLQEDFIIEEMVLLSRRSWNEIT